MNGSGRELGSGSLKAAPGDRGGRGPGWSFFRATTSGSTLKFDDDESVKSSAVRRRRLCGLPRGAGVISNLKGAKRSLTERWVERLTYSRLVSGYWLVEDRNWTPGTHALEAL